MKNFEFKISMFVSILLLMMLFVHFVPSLDKSLAFNAYKSVFVVIGIQNILFVIILIFSFILTVKLGLKKK